MGFFFRGLYQVNASDILTYLVTIKVYEALRVEYFLFLYHASDAAKDHAVILDFSSLVPRSTEGRQ